MEKEQLQQFIGNRSLKVIEAMEMIDRNSSGFILVVDDANRLVGCLTDGDIRRWILKGGRLGAQIEYAMSHEPISLNRDEIANAQAFMRKKEIEVLPIIDGDNYIVDIVFLNGTGHIRKDTEALNDVPVVIMAGGKGTRLYPYTKILPKPLIPIGDTPIVERIMDTYFSYGVKKFYVTVNYKKGMIKAYFAEQELPYDIEFVEEEIPLGTGGSLRLIPEAIRVPIFVANCDSLILTDYEALYNYHSNSENDITIVTAFKKNTIPYGVVHFQEDGKVYSMEEKPTQSFFINSGMYVINPETIKWIPEKEVFHMPQLVETVMKNGGKVGVFPISEDSFLDMGEFDEMKRMESKLNVAVLPNGE